MTQIPHLRRYSAFFVFMAVVLLGGCSPFKGYYNPSVMLLPPHEGQEITNGNVSIRAKALRDFECAGFFDNRMIDKDVQPIQIYIQNNSDTFYVLDGASISVPLLGKRRVGAVLYKNILARSVVWVLGTIAFSWELFLPILLADTIFSMQANKNIKSDLESIALRPKEKVVLAPASRVHKIFFVDTSDYHHHFSITLTKEQGEGELVFRF